MKLLFAVLFLLAENTTLPTQQEDTVKDVDGNRYHTVTIGKQVWMVENLRVTKYNDGTPIPVVKDRKAWSSLATPGYCWYNNKIKYKSTYGALYNWYAVNTGKLAPKGWHVPTDEEWKELTTYLEDGIVEVGCSLKESGFDHWKENIVPSWEPSTMGLDLHGFAALPGGNRGSDGSFTSMGGAGSWWSSTEKSDSSAWGLGMLYYEAGVVHGYSSKNLGASVRCIKD